MTSNKRSLSLPAAARRASKKSTKQVVPHYSQPQADEDDRQLLAQLLAAEPGAEIGVDADADDMQQAEPAHLAPDPGGFPDDRFAHAPAEPDDMTVLQAGEMSRGQQDIVPQGIPRQQDQQQSNAAAAPSVAAISDQTLEHRGAEHTTLPSPMTAAGQRSKRACSNKAKQSMAAFEADTDGDDDSPTPTRRKSNKKQHEDSDYEAGDPSSSSDDVAHGDAASEEDEEFGFSEEEEQPKKKAKKSTGGKKGSVKAGRSRASTGSVAQPKSGRGSAKGSGRTAQASAAGAASGAGHKLSNRAATGRAASGHGRAASCKAAHSLETAGASSFHTTAARQPVTSPAAGAAAGRETVSGSSCAMGGPRSGQRPVRPEAMPRGAGQNTAPLPTAPDVATAGVQSESAGHVIGVNAGAATTAASDAGPIMAAASAVSHHGPSLSRPRLVARTAEETSPAHPTASMCSASSKANSLSSNSSSLAGSRKQLGVRTGGRLGLGFSAAGTGGGSAGLAAGSDTLSAGGAAVGGMFGGPAFRVPGLRRPGPKRPVAQ